MSKKTGKKEQKRRAIALSDTRAKNLNTSAKANDSTELTVVARSLAGGRATQDTSNMFPGVMPTWVAPEVPEDTWRVLDLDADALGRFPPWRILELLVDLSPDVSRALFDFLNFCNPDWTIFAYKPGTKDVSTRALASIRQFLGVLRANYGSIDVVWNRLFLNTWLRGGIFMELVLDSDGKTPIDLATPDPLSARFKQTNDAKRGIIWHLGQLQAGKGFVDLSNRQTIRYLPVHPLPGVPYGRPLAASALFAALFFLGVLHDIRRVIAQQGYPRIDIAVDFEAMQAAMPADAADDPERFNQWVQAAINEVVNKYKTLQPDDAYVHSSTITINKPVGTVDAESLGGIKGLIESLERMLVKALKTMPLISGMTDGVSEANANRQTEIYLLGIRAVQNLIETGLEWLLTLMLRAQGIQADIVFEFAENRATEELRDAQVMQLKLQNAEKMYNLGFADIDEASQYAVGHNADQRETRTEQRQQAMLDRADAAAKEAGKEKKAGKVTGDVLPDNANAKKEKPARAEMMDDGNLIWIGPNDEERRRARESAGD